MLCLRACSRGWIAIGVDVMGVVVLGPLALWEGMGKPQWPPQTAATSDLMGPGS